MFLNALNVIFICFEVIVFFNLMIIVHELGHFLAARWRGLVIERFGIWFGKPLWEKEIGGVIYSLGSIPAGGFVALPQLAPMEVMEGKVETPRDQLPPISALDKIIVALAGPVFSFLLAAFFAVIVWQVGRPVTMSEKTTTIGYVDPASPLAKDVKVGDEILEIDGRPIKRWQGMSEDSVTWRVVRSEGETIQVKVKRQVAGKPDEILEFFPKPVIPKTKSWNRRGLRQIMIAPAETPMVAKVEAGSTAEKVGLKPNDLITEVNGERLFNVLGISEYAHKNPGAELVLTVDRGGQSIKVPFEVHGPQIGAVLDNSPAMKAGLKVGDRITAVDGKEFRAAGQITEYVQQNAGAPLILRVESAGQSREVKITPEKPEGETIPRIGVMWDMDGIDGIVWDRFGKFEVIYPGPVEQLRAGFASIVNTVDAIFSKKSDVGVQHMGGPVMMMRVYYIMFENPEGWRLALWFSVILNVNLALLNLLPIPVLDGGHITLAIVEAVRRKPVNVRVLEYLQTACAFIIIGFMIFIAFFDVQDLFPSRKEPSTKFQNATPAQSK